MDVLPVKVPELNSVTEPLPTLVIDEEPESTMLEFPEVSPQPTFRTAPGPYTSVPPPLRDCNCAPFLRMTVAPEPAVSVDEAGSELGPSIMSVPADTVVAPEYVLVPERIKVPLPALVSAKLPETAPTVRVDAATVTVESAVITTEPALKSRELVPWKVKLPPQTSPIAGSVKVLFASSVAPAEMVRLPVPRAFTLPITSVPCARVVPPEYVLVPDRSHWPVPCFRSAVLLAAVLLEITPDISPVPALEP